MKNKIKNSGVVRKLLSVITAVLMALGVVAGTAIPAFAEGADYKITIDNSGNQSVSINGKTYYALKLFDANYDTTDETKKDTVAYTISTNSTFYTTKAYKDILDKYFDFGDISSDSTTKTVTAKGGTLSNDNARALADALAAKIPDQTKTENSLKATAADEKATIDVGAPGYYIVLGSASPKSDSTKEVVSAVALTTTNPTATVNPKVEVPSLSKKITGVKENDTTVDNAVLDNEGKAAVAKVGSTVSFQLDSKVPDLTGYSTYTYTITDTLTAGLDYVATTADTSNVVVKIGGTNLTSGYTVNVNNKTLTVTIDYNTLNAHQNDNDKNITVTYDAKVNASSLAHNFEKNTANLTYSNSPYASGEGSTNTTPNQDTYVLNINVNVTKVEKGTDTKLANAEFKLYKQVGTTKSYYKYDTENNTVTWVNLEDQGDTFKTKADGTLEQAIRGLDKGTYYLDETVAPAGYNKLADPVTIEISASEANGKVTYKVNNKDVTNGTVTISGDQTATHPVANVQVENSKGSLLPSTGGIGTTLFYIAGGILIIGAAALLIERRKRNA